MAKFVKKVVAPANDPAEVANKRILRDIDKREAQKQHEATLATDLGLDLKDPESTADNPADFLRDEWDKKTFGDSIPTYTRVLYGPDPLLISCPALKADLERLGLEEYAQATAETILLKQENAVPDPVMKKGLRAAIARFGVASVADAFRKRILKIPCRTVEIEADRSDAMIMSEPMQEAVERYGTPGMAPKFLSELCIKRFGCAGTSSSKTNTASRYRLARSSWAKYRPVWPRPGNGTTRNCRTNKYALCRNRLNRTPLKRSSAAAGRASRCSRRARRFVLTRRAILTIRRLRRAIWGAAARPASILRGKGKP